MEQKIREILNKIEWISVFKSTVFIIVVFFVGMLITTITSLVFVAVTDGFSSGVGIANKYEWMLHVVDVFIFLGFYKSISFFKDHKLYNMILVTVIVAVLPLISLFWYPEDMIESLINTAIIFGIMFAAYGVYLVINREKLAKT